MNDDVCYYHKPSGTKVRMANVPPLLECPAIFWVDRCDGMGVRFAARECDLEDCEPECPPVEPCELKPCDPTTLAALLGELPAGTRISVEIHIGKGVCG